MPMAHGCGARMIQIVILAAGHSSRMRGRDKLLEDIGGTALLRRTVMRAQATGCRVLVTLPDAPHPRYGTLDGLDVDQIAVPDADEGINASLRAGIGAVREDKTAAMILLADMPEITTADLQTMMDAVATGPTALIWRATTQSGAAGHPIVFHKSLFPALMALEGDHGGNAVVKHNAEHTVHVALPDNHARTDLDTPEDWAEWKTRNALLD